MTQQISLAPVATSAPPTTGHPQLPSDLLEDAAHRLRVLCVVVVTLLVLNQVANLTFRTPVLSASLTVILSVVVALASGAVRTCCHGVCVPRTCWTWGSSTRWAWRS